MVGVTVNRPRAILLDIEGTTTSISFVKDTLFPIARDFLNDFVDNNWDTDQFKEDVALLRLQNIQDIESRLNGVPLIVGPDEPSDVVKKSLVANVLWQMDNDRKTPGLKQLQGHIWSDAYESETIKGHVYDDVPTSLKKWKFEDGISLFVYSSGSVEAQKLLFKYSCHGDMLPLFSDHFDATIGPKTELLSYKRISETIYLDPKDILFLSDVPRETNPASQAGFQTILVVREGNEELTPTDKSTFNTICSFEELNFI